MGLTRRTMLAAAAAVGAAPALGAEGQRLRVGMAAPNTTLDPHLASNAPNNAVASHIYDALVTNDEQSRSRPGLAESWSVADGVRWDFVLRPGAVFSDGSPFTAADAIASVERAANAPGTGAFRTYTRSIKSMVAEGPHVLRVETHAPDPLLPNSLSRIRMVSARFKDADAAAFNSGAAALGTGPFVLREYVPGSRIALARNDRWWGPKLPWSEVVLSIATDRGGRLASLLAGDLDIIEQVPAESMPRVEGDARFHLIRGTSARLAYFAMDTFREVTPDIAGNDGKPLGRNPLKDARVRAALDCAINRPAIVERVMSGVAIVAAQFLPQGGAGNAPGLEPTKFDPARARALLAEAGYPDGFRLVLRGPGDRIVNDSKIVQAVAQMFTRVGIQTTAEVMPWAVYASRAAATEFSVFLTTWAANTGEASNPLSAIVATYDRGAGMGIANEGRYSNPAVDALLKRASGIMDDGARNALLAEASGVAFRDHAVLPLHHEVSVWAARRGVTYATRADQYTLAAGVGVG